MQGLPYHSAPGSERRPAPVIPPAVSTGAAAPAAPRTRRAVLRRVVVAAAGTAVMAACDLRQNLEGVPLTGMSPTEVIYASWGTPLQRERENWTLLSFQKNYQDIKMSLIWAPTAAAFMPRVHGLLASGTPADLVHLPSWSAPTFYAEEAVIRLGDYMRRDGFRPTHLTPPFDVCTYRRSWYALPRGNNGLYVVFYNRTAFATAGLSWPQDDWTWDGFLQAARQLTRPAGRGEPQRWGTTLQGLGKAYHAWLWANGGDELERRSGRPVLTEPPAIEALQWLADLHLQHEVAPAPGALRGDGLAAFEAGQVAMWYGPGEAELALARRIEEFDWGMAAQPRGTAGAHGHYRPNVVAVLTGSRQPDDAWELAQFLVDPDIQRQEWEHRLWHPQAPSLLQEEAYLRPPVPPHDRRPAVPGAILRPRTPVLIPRIDEVRTFARTELVGLWSGQRSAQEVAEAIAHKIDSIR